MVPKSGLLSANADRKGHFRIISNRVWDEYVKLYPGSGPKILVVSCPVETIVALSRILFEAPQRCHANFASFLTSFACMLSLLIFLKCFSISDSSDPTALQRR